MRKQPMLYAATGLQVTQGPPDLMASADQSFLGFLLFCLFVSLKLINRIPTWIS